MVDWIMIPPSPPLTPEQVQEMQRVLDEIRDKESKASPGAVPVICPHCGELFYT